MSTILAFRLTVSAALLALLSGCGTPEQVVGANWAEARQTPTGHEFTPKPALRHDIAGLVILRCSVGQDQTATDCHVIYENPRNLGFAESALKMTPGMRARIPAPGFAPPKVGTYTLNPVFFCPAVGTGTCKAELKIVAHHVTEEIRAVGRMIDIGQCVSARRAAEGVGPDLASVVAAGCAGKP